MTEEERQEVARTVFRRLADKAAPYTQDELVFAIRTLNALLTDAHPMKVTPEHVSRAAIIRDMFQMEAKLQQEDPMLQDTLPLEARYADGFSRLHDTLVAWVTAPDIAPH